MKEETQRNMSRLSIVTQNSAQKTVEGLYKDLERRITASQRTSATPSPAASAHPAGWALEDWRI